MQPIEPETMAWYYHAHHSLDMEDLPFWLGLAQEQGGPILELGCGTGRLLLPLLKAGYEMCGVELNPAMLAVLKAQLPKEMQPAPQLIEGDFTQIDLGRRFPLIILPCNTLSTLPRSARQKLFAVVNAHLAKNGKFAASLPNPDDLRELPEHVDTEPEEFITDPLNGDPVQISSDWDHDDEIFHLRWHYDRMFSEGEVQRHTAQVTHDLAKLEVYEADLLEAGLEIEALFGDFDGSEYEPDAPQLIFIASKA